MLVSVNQFHRECFMDELKRLSNKLLDAVTDSGQPTLVLAIISLVIAAAVVLLLYGTFGG